MEELKISTAHRDLFLDAPETFPQLNGRRPSRNLSFPISGSSLRANDIAQISLKINLTEWYQNDPGLHAICNSECRVALPNHISQTSRSI